MLLAQSDTGPARLRGVQRRELHLGAARRFLDLRAGPRLGNPGGPLRPPLDPSLPARLADFLLGISLPPRARVDLQRSGEAGGARVHPAAETGFDPAAQALRRQETPRL